MTEPALPSSGYGLSHNGQITNDQENQGPGLPVCPLPSHSCLWPHCPVGFLLDTPRISQLVLSQEAELGLEEEGQRAAYLPGGDRAWLMFQVCF